MPARSDELPNSAAGAELLGGKTTLRRGAFARAWPRKRLRRHDMFNWFGKLFYNLVYRNRGRKPTLPRRALLCEPLERRQVPAALDYSTLFTNVGNDTITFSYSGTTLSAIRDNGTTTATVTATDAGGNFTVTGSDNTFGDDSIVGTGIDQTNNSTFTY